MSFLTFPAFFDTGDLVSEIIILTTGLFGVCGCTITILAILRSKSVSGPTARLFATLLFSDGLLCLVAFVIAITFFINYREGTDTLDHAPACAMYGGVILACVFTSMMSLTAVTLERYRAVVLRRVTTIREASAWCAAIVACACVVALVTALNGVMGEQPGRLMCVTRWWDEGTVWVTVLFLSILGCSLAAMTFFWTRIVQVIFSSTSSIKSQSSDVKARRGSQRPKSIVASSKSMTDTESSIDSKPPMNQMDRKKSDMLEKKVLMNAVIVTSMFLILWAPYVFVILFSVGSGKPVSSNFDRFAVIAATWNSALNPALLFWLDRRIRKNVKEFLGFQ